MIFDISLRYKLPLWGGALILSTALALSTSFAIETLDNLRQDLRTRSEDLGRSMSRQLFPILLHDDPWQAYKTISLPFQDRAESALAESIVVFDKARHVYVSSHPLQHPMRVELASLGSDFRELDKALSDSPTDKVFVHDSAETSRIFVVVPIVNDAVRLGTLVVVYGKSLLWQRFAKLIDRAVWITLLILGVLLPVSWYWGRRMVEPMRLVAQRMARIGAGEEIAGFDPAVYPYRDEVGEIYRACEIMASGLRHKARLEKEVLKNERMAAVGRLTASIAHEINNPLGGMLNAISTLKRHGNPDDLTQKTIVLLERSLTQIRETVAALLVEAKVKSRPLTPQDIDDVRLLVTPLAKKHGTRTVWDIRLPESLPLPSTLVRQVLINLSLNAIQASGTDGAVSVQVEADQQVLTLTVENNGKSISQAQQECLFEPFTRFSDSGSGLGLWICYQIVTQLGGDIRADSSAALTRFSVTLPLDHRHAPDAK